MKHCEYQQIDPQALSTPTPTLPPQHAVVQEEKKGETARRKWEVFPGKNRFYCDGRIIVAQQSGVLPLTLGLILVTTVLFFVFDCPFLLKHLTVFIPAIGGVLFVFVVISLLQTSFTDPGILPRATADEAADIEKQIDNSGSSTYRPPPRTKEVMINQQVVKLKYCFTCKMFRPPRTSHCSLCDNCVERFDHHCPWVGNCVGKRNYRFFYTFIVSLSFLTVFIFGCVATHLALRAQGGRGLMFALQESPASAVELVICFFSVWSILGLSGFHTYLVASNLTTNEDIKGSWSGKSGTEDTGNPYSYNNIITNCCSVLCGPMPPSLIDRRGFMPVEESSQTVATEIELAAKNEINVCQLVLCLSVFVCMAHHHPPLGGQLSGLCSVLCWLMSKCTQGTKDLLESASRSPCPQTGKPQTVSTSCPESIDPADPAVTFNPDVTPDPVAVPSLKCGGRHHSHTTSPPDEPRQLHHHHNRHHKTRSARSSSKRAALHISNPAYNVSLSPPTSPGLGPSHGTGAEEHVRDSFATLH
ncbi:palmitoyltransferase ZDHHC18-B-like isoform X1 [Oncorhynchus keta]|uniref:palmitoyltransferase ZDHHC18-B-like isoform X1 n=1 Tax=Oncorhynchus keta TaxID=8018 RepID=UPI00227C0DC3|nr:palmitoyltransferase ZDHHC18-B-like isoform X1 [Oncorhynchus keta]